MSETFDRPNKPGIWQREDNMRFFVGRDGDSDSVLINLVLDGNPYTRYSWMATAVLAVGRYRKIADEYGNPLRDPDEPWPPKTRKEKRRVVQYRTSGAQQVVDYLSENNRYAYGGCHVISDEIRDCIVDENSEVIRVLKEGE